MNKKDTIEDEEKLAKSIDNIETLKPKMNFTEVIKKYGYPAISKKQSYFLHQLRNTKSEIMIDKLLRGIMRDGSITMFKISEKWKPFIDSEIKLSNKCCDIMKKNPSKKFEKEY